MMGGATENDEAMKWFLNRADGGDILVLRASGSDGYNDYMYSDLGITLNSVETLVFNDVSAANETYIHEKIAKAEGIWFAGGNQWNYVSYWRDSPISSLINEAIHDRNIVIGGTSAGMAILGKYYFSAENGTITSESALMNPYHVNITVDSTSFLQVNYMQDVVTDSHYDDPDRKGRHITFLARILTDYGVAAKGIACNEYTAVCIDENGLARVYGEYPAYPETAFFLQTNCELSDFSPENCTPSNPLDWNLNGTAVRVYKVNGTNEGTNTFDLNGWKTGNGGTWENWYIDNGNLVQTDGTQIECTVLSTQNQSLESSLNAYPNPFDSVLNISSDHNIIKLTISDVNGKVIMSKDDLNTKKVTLNTELLFSGIYNLKLSTQRGTSFHKLVKK